MLWIDNAIAYCDAGINVIPLRCDGSKAPAIASWKRFQTYSSRMPLISWYRDKPWYGLGIVCGRVSGGLEVLDFDHYADETFDAWRRMIPPSAHGKLCVVETAGGGYHVIYKAVEVSGNHKIAMAAGGQVLIESRGEGGYIVAVGSPCEVHSSGRPYVQVMGEPLPSVPTMTLDERRAMWLAAAEFDQRPDSKEQYIRERIKKATPSTPADRSTPWGDFDARADWCEILEPAGWTSSDGVHWTRPGKSDGLSAKIVLAADGDEVLTVFSQNAGPLAPRGGRPTSWGKFNAFRLLHHDGDSSAAAKAARRMGYGGVR